MASKENGREKQIANGWNLQATEELLEDINGEQLEMDTQQNKDEGKLKRQNRKCNPFWRKWCRHGCGFWCRKYFWEG